MNKKKQLEPSLLLLGKQYTKANPNQIGGVIVLFETLKEDLNNLNIRYDVVDLNWKNYKTPIHAYIFIFLKVLRTANKYQHISLHGTANEFFFLAPIFVYFTKKIYRKKISLRKFAGNFDTLFENSSVIHRCLAKYALNNADVVFFETRYLVNYFKKFNDNTLWFPNVRKSSIYKTDEKYEHRFVFIGQVKKTKGISEIIGAFSKLDDDSNIDIYGPISNEYSIEQLNTSNIKYKGTANVTDVPKILSQYDILILPTFHKGEGYPGIIIESYSVGVPVIATNLRGIREISSRDSALLIDPESIDQLLEVIQNFNQSIYIQFHKGALRQFSKFESTYWTKKFLQRIDHQL